MNLRFLTVDALKVKILTETVGGTVRGAILNRAALESADAGRREIEETLGVQVIGTIPEDPNARRAAAARAPVVMAYPDSESSKAFRKIAAAMAGFPVGEKPDTVQEGFIERLTRALLRRD